MLAPALGPESMATRVNTHRPAPGVAGSGAVVSTCPAEGLPQSPNPLDSTCPLTVFTAPPDAFWHVIGMSTCWRLGHSHTAPPTTAIAIAASTPITILAGSGSKEDRADDKLCECE